MIYSVGAHHISQVRYPRREYRRKENFECKQEKYNRLDSDPHLPPDYCEDCCYAEEDIDFHGCPGKWEEVEPVRHLVHTCDRWGLLKFRCGKFGNANGSCTWISKEPPTCPDCIEWLDRYLCQEVLPFPNGMTVADGGSIYRTSGSLFPNGRGS